jgi:hypothetical protein
MTREGGEGSQNEKDSSVASLPQNDSSFDILVVGIWCFEFI